MPYWMELVVRFHEGRAVVSRSVWSTIEELSLDQNWYPLAFRMGWET